jgi:hypothetical protein
MENTANKTRKTIQKASEIKYLNPKRYCSQAIEPAQIEKRPAACLCAPAWAVGPAANGWAGQVAQLLNPPGLKVAQPAARRPPPSIARSMAENQSANFAGVYKADEL